MATVVTTAGQSSKRPKLARKGFKTYAPIHRYSKGKKRLKGQLSLSKLKKELDRIFSLYIRAKYGPNCYTCSSEKGTQNGHWIIRQYLATRWDEDNCRPQGFGCNIRGKGMSIDFEERLTKEIGPERVQALKDKRKELWKLDRTWYETQIAHYKALYESLTS